MNRDDEIADLSGRSSISIGRIMKKPKEWYDKNLRLNQNHILQIGDRVRDYQDREGEIIKIYPHSEEDWLEHGPLTVEDHGSITVLLDNPIPYDKEHWCLIDWHRCLRRID